MRTNKYIFSLKFLIFLFIIVLLSGSSEADKEPERYISYDSDVNAMAISADSRYLVTGNCQYNGKNLHLYDLVNQTTVWSKAIGGSQCIWGVDISADGQYIVAGQGYNSSQVHVYLFSKDSNIPLWSYDTGSNYVSDVAISLNGETIAVTTQSGDSGDDLYVFDVSSSTPLWSKSVENAVEGLEISADGNLVFFNGKISSNNGQTVLMVNSRSSSVPLWVASTGSSSNDCCTSPHERDTMGISLDGNWITVARRDSVFLYDVSSRFPVWSYQIPGSPDGKFRDVDISKDGKIIAAAHENGKTYVFNSNSSTPKFIFSQNVKEGGSVELSYYGDYLVTNHYDTKVSLYNLSSGELVWVTNKQSRNTVLTLAITFDAEKIIMFSDSNRGIYIYNNTLTDERSIYPLSTPEVKTNVVNLSWIPNGLNSSDFKYDIYLGTNSSNPSLFASNLSVRSYQATNLTIGGTYFWKVVAKFNGSSISTPIYSFRVNNLPSVSPSFPLDDAVWFSSTLITTWSASDSDGDALQYTVYLDTSSDPSTAFCEGKSTTSCLITDLSLSEQTYYWKVKAFDGLNSTFSSVRSFDTLSKTEEWAVDLSGNSNVYIDVSGDGQYIVAGNSDDTLYFHESGDSTDVWSSDLNSDIHDVALSDDAEYMAAGGNFGLHLYDTNATTGTVNVELLWSYTDINVYAHDMDISSDGQYLLICSDDDKLIVFSKDSNNPLWIASIDRCKEAKFSADGQFIAMIDENTDLVSKYHISSSSPLFSFSTIDPRGVDISKDGYVVAVHGYNSELSGNYYLSLYHGNYYTRTIEKNAQYTEYNVKLSADGSCVAISSYNTQVVVYKSSDNFSSYNTYSTDTDNSVYGPFSITPDCKYLAAVMESDGNRGVYYYGIEDSSSPLWYHKYSSTAYYRNIRISDEGRVIVAGLGSSTYDLLVYNWDYASEALIYSSYPRNYGSTGVNAKLGWGVAGEDMEEFTYKLLVGNSSSNLSVYASGLTNRSYVLSNLDAGEKYFWQIKLYDDGDFITQTDIRSFTVSSSSSAKKYTPLVDHTRYYNTVTFTWDTDEDLLYQILLGIDGNDFSPQSDLWLSTGSLEVTDLVTNRTYYWKLQTFDGSQFSTSSTSQFSIVPNTPVWTKTLSSKEVIASKISGDGNYTIIGYDDGSLYLFSKINNTKVWSYTAEDKINSVSISLDGSSIVAASDDDYVYFFNLTGGGTPAWKHSLGGKEATAVAVSSDGKYIIAGGEKDIAYLFDKGKTGDTYLWSIELSGEITAVDISSDGEYVVVGAEVTSSNSRVHVFDKDSNTTLWTDLVYGDITSISISADSNFIAVGTAKDRIYFYDRTSNEPEWSFSAADTINELSLSSDGKYLAACSEDENLYLFETSSATPKWSLDFDSDVNSVDISSNGDDIVVVLDDGGIYHISKDSYIYIWVFPDGTKQTSASISDDGNSIVSGSVDGKVSFFISPYSHRSYINTTVPSVISSGTDFTIVGYSDNSTGVSKYSWSSDIDGLVSNSTSMNTNGLTVGTHTIIFQSQYNGTSSRTIPLAPLVDSSTWALWRFDEESGSTLQDATSNNRDASIQDGASRTSDGKFGNAMDFEANSGSWVDWPNFEDPSEFTLEAWIKLESDDYSGNKYIISFNKGGHFDFYVNSNEVLGISVRGYDDGACCSTYTKIGSTSLEPGVWYHVAAAYSESNDYMKIYLNGTEEASYSLDEDFTMYDRNYYNRIGHKADGQSEYTFDGIIDEFRISTVARTSFTFNTTFNTTIWSHPSAFTVKINAPPTITSVTVSPTTSQHYSEGGLIGTVDSKTSLYWTFDEGSGSKVFDSTPYNWFGYPDNYNEGSDPEWTSGIFGGALDFEVDDNSYVRLNNGRFLYGTVFDSATVEAWINPESNDATNEKYILHSRSPYLRMYLDDLYLTVTYCTEEEFDSDIGESCYTFSSSVQVELNSWSHVAMVFDGTNNTINLYQNKILVASRETTPGHILYSEASSDFYLGTEMGHNAGTKGFDGKIDEFRISLTNRQPSEFLYSDNANITFSFSATDTDGSISNVTWISDVDGVLSYLSMYSVNATSLTHGYHNITVNLTDNEGNYKLSNPVMIRIKGIPIVNITGVTPNALLSGTEVGFTATASDIDGPITKYQWSSDLDGIISISKDFSTSSLSAGYHNITFRAQDVDGYWSFRDYEHVLVTGIEVTPDFGVQGSGFSNPSFNYYRDITLSSPTSSSNQSVMIVLNNTNFNYSYTKSDGADLRFYSTDGSTKYSYWIERWDNTSVSNIWVKIPNQGIGSFYMLYGNSVLESESNGTAVFDFFDGFSGSSIDTDLWEGDTSVFSVCNGQMNAGSSCGGTGQNNDRLKSKTNWSGSYVVKTRVLVHDTSWGGFQAAGWYDDSCDGIGAGFYHYEEYYVVRNDCSQYNGDMGWNYDGEWVTVTLTADGTNSKVSYYNEDDDAYYNRSFSNSGLDNEVLALGRHNCDCWYTYTYSARWDWIFVYPLSSSTPSVGAHQSGNLPFTPVINNITFKITISDSHSLISNYTWFSSKEGYIGNTSSFTLNASTLTSGNHTISVRIKDSSGDWSGWSNFTYKIFKTPTVTSLNVSAWMDDQGDRVFFNGTGSDSDGTIVRYRWTSSIDGLLSTQASFNTTSLSPGNHTIEFVVQDNSTLWSSKSDRWLYINDQPIATIVSVSPITVYTNGSILIDKPEVDSNTIHMWRFDEGSGSSTSDDGSYGWTGNLQSGVSWVNGKSGYALEFGSDSVISTSSTSSHNGEVTIEAWIYLSDDNYHDENCIIQWGTSPVSLCFNHYGDKVIVMKSDFDNDGEIYLKGSSILYPDTWYHVAGTISESEDVMKLYINGTEDASYTFDSSYELRHWGEETVIGDDCIFFTCDTFAGYIDEVRISNIARTSFVLSDNITFNGSATDQSGSVEAYSWTSSIDGELSTQAIFTIHESELSFGNHTISFKAQDETGAWSVPKTTNIIVRSFPYAKITSIEPWYVNIGTQVNFTATALAPDSANLTEYIWWSSIDGNLSTNLTFSTTDLSYGNHTILFKAKNSRGEWSQPYFANDGVSFVLVNDIPIASINSIAPNPATKGEGRAPPVDQYTIGYWPFRESTGTETIDESGQKNNATLKGSQFETGIWDSSVYFDGNSDYLYVTKGNALSDLGDNDFTLEAWIYPTRSMTSGQHSIIRNDGDYNLFVNNGYLRAEVWYGEDVYWAQSDDTYMSSTNTWYHVAASWDSDDLEWTIFINGGLPQDSNSGDHTGYDWDYALWFGNSARYDDETFKGRIDEVRISSTERSSSSLLYYTTIQSIIEFEGSGSDGDGSIEGNQWKSDIQGSLSTLGNFSLSAANFTVDSHTISYKVQDDDGVWSPWATSSLDVRSYPTSQIVSISPNSTSEGLSVTFTGNASDPDSSETFVTYRWWSSIDGWLSDSKTFSYSDWSPGNHTIYLQVKDNQGYWSMPVSSELFINNVPTASIDSINPSPAYNNNATYTTVTFNGTVLDADGSITEYYWSSSVNGELSTSSNFVLNVNTLSNGNHTITFRGKDNYGAWSPNVTTYLKVFENPDATIDSVSGNFVNQYAKLWLNGTGSDEDGSVTNYTWTSSIDGLIGTLEDISLSTLTPGNHTITFKVKDNDGLWSTGAATNVEINARPVVTLGAKIPTIIYGFTGSTSVQGPDDDTLAFWHLDESSGPTAYDSSSSNKHGTWKNNPSNGTGLFENGVKFDGSNDYIQVPEIVSGVFEIVTIEAWVKLSSDVGEDDNWVIFGGGQDGTLKVGINDDEKPFVYVDSGDSFGSKTVTANKALESGYWYHIAAIYDSSQNQIQIYLNHNLVANSSIQQNFVLERSAFDMNSIGSSAGGSQDFFNGVIDEVRISDIRRNTTDMVFRKDASYVLAFASDSDDTIQSMKWMSDLDGNLGTTNSGIFPADMMSAGRHNITFRAMDPHGFWSEYVNFTLTVKMYPRASITSISPNSTVLGTTITFNATSSDSDGNVVAYRWKSSKEGIISISENFTLSNLSAGYHRISYQVKDNTNLWSVIDEADFYLNQIPVASIDSLGSNPVYKNNLTLTSVTLNGSGSDDDGTITHYLWNSSKDGSLSTEGNFSLSLNTLSVGNHTISLQVRDNFTTWSPKVYSWLVVKAYPNASIDYVSKTFANETDNIEFRGSGSDEDGIIQNFLWYSSIDGQISNLQNFNITTLNPGEHYIYLKVKDDNGLWSREEGTNITINGKPVGEITSEVPNVIFEFSGNNTIIDSDENTIAFWHFDEEDGTKAFDSSSNSFDAQLVNSPDFDTGLFGNSIHLDGVNDYLLIPELKSGSHSEVTFEAWIMLESEVEDGKEAIIYSGGKDGVIEWGINDNQKVFLYLRSSNFGDKMYNTNITIDTDKWYHLAFVYSDQSDIVKFYSNHVLINEYSFESNLVLLRSITNDNRIGIGLGSSGNHFEGQIDEFRISDAVRNTFIYGYDMAYFSADASDFENSISEVFWTSSLDGQISDNLWWHFGADALSFGNHTITFQVRDEYGVLSDEVESYLNILAHPESTILSVSSQASDYGVPLSFSGKAEDEDGNASSLFVHEWKSDIDGVFSTELSPDSIILSPGYHTITFKIKDEDGLWSITDTTFVLVNDLPSSIIESVGPNPAYKYNETEQIVALIGLAIDNDGNITAHYWNSSLDGIIGYDNLSFISANNLTVGNHTITYQCRDDFGTWSEIATTQILIQSHPKSYIQNITPGFQAEDEPVQFLGDGTDEDGNIQFYRWYSSIDGLIGVFPNFNTTELSPGNHTISFKVKDDSNLWSDYDTSYVVINSRPTVELINSVPELIYAYGPDNDLQVADIYTLGYWHFDDVYDNKANDSSFYNNDISVQGNPTVSSGLFGSSLDLDGSLDSFSIPQMVPSGAFDEVTIESWVYLTSDYNFDRNRVIFAGGWDGHLEFGISLNHEAYVSVSSDNFGTIQIFSENEINKLQWYHIAVVYSEQNDEINLYINGVHDSSIVIANQFELSRSALVENCIGASSGCSGRNFIGLIDEVRITRTLLYPEQFLYREDSAYVSAIAVDYDSTITGGIWESDIDGIIGTDLWLSKSALEWTPGRHNLTFRAVDEYNVWSINYTTQLYVSTYPVVSNLSLESLYANPVDQELVWFNASVDDYDGGSLINFQWFSSIDGNLGEGLDISKRLSNGSHEIRFRAQDDEGHWSAWEYRNYFVDVHPINDIQIESEEAYRGNIMPISIKIGDNLTLQSQFTVEIEINGTGLDWSKQYMVQPDYNGEHWEGYFAPTLDMPPGNYQIRGRTIQDQARSTHDEIRTTPWIHLLDVQVINNAPVIKEVIFSNTTLQRNQETSLKLNIIDLESTSNLSVLDISVFYFDKVEEEWLTDLFSEVYFNESSGLFELIAIPPSDLKVGKYDLMIQVIDLDGELVELTQDKFFTVVNSPPNVYTIEEEISDSYIQGNSSFWVNVTSEDFDGDIYRYEWRSNREGALPCVTEECELDPSNLLPGIHEIRVYAVDDDDELSEPLIFEIEILEAVYEGESKSALVEFYGSLMAGNPLVLGVALLVGLLSVFGTLRFREREEVFVEEEFEDVLPRDPVQAWLPPLELNDHEAILAEFFVKRRESYLAYPNNEEILDFLHNNRKRYTISSYFEVPTSPTELLHEWALPANLRYNVHLDDVRKSIVNTILDDTTGKNFVIIGEPGVGKSVIGFDVFDRLMDRMPVGRITTYSVGNVHEKFGIRLFYDDIPENPELIQILQERKLKGLIVTAREADWRSLPKEFQDMFERLTVPLFSEDEMLNLASRMLAFSGLMYEPQALDKLAVYSEGSPIYVWSLIRELVSKDVKKLTLTYLNENSMKGMTNYVSLLLQQLLKDAGKYKSGGYHTLSAVNFLSTHMAEKNSHEIFFRAFSEQLSEHTTKIFGDKMDTMTFNHAMGYLSGEGSQVRFPHDTWADVLEGEGSMNPFRAEIQTIVQEFADTGLFETVKREAVPKAWETAVNRYKKSPSRQHEALLALADTLFRNFGVKDLNKLGVDSDLVLEVATTYSHLPIAAMLVSKIQAATPQQITKIINIQDTVSEQKGFGEESSHPPYTMEELYLVYSDGRLISSEHSREAKVDSDIMSSMLTAINDFVKDSFQTEGNLGAIDYGENKIILERGDNTVLAAVVYGEATRDLRSKMGSAVREIEEKFAENLVSWNGDIDKLSATKEILSTIIGITDGVSREMIEDYLSMQEVRMRSTPDEFKGFLEIKAHINNYASKDITDVVLGLDYNKSKLKLVKVFPSTKYDSFKINIDELRGYNDLELKLYFEVLEKKNIGLNFRLDYTNPRGEGSQVSSTPCDGFNFKTSVKKPKLKDLEFEEEVAETPEKKVETPVESVETIKADSGEIDVLESNVEEVEEKIEEVKEEEVEESVDLGESGMDDLLGKLDELNSESTSKDKNSKKSAKKDSDDGMDDLMGKLDEL